jgi:hypothetical protein
MANRLRKNSLVHKAKPVESTILIGVSKNCPGMGRSPVLIEANAISAKLEIVPDIEAHASEEAEKRFSASC